MLIQTLVFVTKYNEIIEREKLYFSFDPPSSLSPHYYYIYKIPNSSLVLLPPTIAKYPTPFFFIRGPLSFIFLYSKDCFFRPFLKESYHLCDFRFLFPGKERRNWPVFEEVSVVDGAADVNLFF
uniref:Uncharacterized protein LOC104224140 isoform X2 n=1 Tax=Nicotiana sylvestris TaxID=4096 RepID=A0A1U7WIG3_NICSY|nr:PREDICTED: uncharacterized protein LOC104224140 isoform X2 [Nicotiana sylvestris]